MNFRDIICTYFQDAKQYECCFGTELDLRAAAGRMGGNDNISRDDLLRRISLPVPNGTIEISFKECGDHKDIQVNVPEGISPSVARKTLELLTTKASSIARERHHENLIQDMDIYNKALEKE